nr:MAG TPA: hypothetical protein [Caudoviricetes sp.]DAZ66502.1 MAG TPA: hypothetical protein [Caudoviricetes sp.]
MRLPPLKILEKVSLLMPDLSATEVLLISLSFMYKFRPSLNSFS